LIEDSIKALLFVCPDVCRVWAACTLAPANPELQQTAAPAAEFQYRWTVETPEMPGVFLNRILEEEVSVCVAPAFLSCAESCWAAPRQPL
jgi:hypothetical protein